MLAILAPGQGSQSPGMLSPWLEIAGVREKIEQWSELSGRELLRLGTTAGVDEVRDTSNAQVLIVATSLLSWHLMRGEISGDSLLFAGHSVGEISAAYFAGVLDEEDAIRVVANRGNVMASASSEKKSGMSAILGGAREDVIVRLQELNLEAANENGAGQIVAAGLIRDLERLSEHPPSGARVRRLEVAGAFHTHHMSSAQLLFQSFVRTIEFRNPDSILLSNRDGSVINSGDDVKERLVSQISSPVRWDLCMKQMRELGVTDLLEVAPGGTLIGLIKRELPEVRTFAIKGPSDLDSAQEFLAKAQ
ncbi:MAG: ACP S-malonyltransferase [Actinobacteria bacterium]|nr:ACP S-malonyltransferase [Actinomycetota bacterium]